MVSKCKVGRDLTLRPTLQQTNDITIVTLREAENEFFGQDLRDKHNEPAFYNTTKRGYKKAAQALAQAWTDKTTMREAMEILRDNGIRTRSFYEMD